MEKNIPPFKISNEQADEIMGRQSHLAKQSFDQISSLDPAAHHVISRQATVNIGKFAFMLSSIKVCLRYNWSCRTR